MEGHGRRYLPARAEISADKSGDILYIFNHLIYSHYHTTNHIPHSQKGLSARTNQPAPFSCAQSDEAGKGGKEQAERLENSANRPIWLFSFAFPLFQVSFWSLSGLIQGLSGNKETKDRLWPRTKPEKKQSKILIIQHPLMPQILPTDLSNRS